LKTNIKAIGALDYVTFIEGKSPWIDPSKVATPIDYLFIDGDHRARWVLADYHYWFPFVRVGGRIAFHDVHTLDWAGRGVRKAIELILDTDDSVIELAAETTDRRYRGTKVFEKVDSSVTRKQMLTSTLSSTFILVSDSENSESLEYLSKSIEAKGYASSIISPKDVKKFSECAILMAYGVYNDCGFSDIKAKRRVMFVPGELGNIGSEPWTRGWDVYGFADRSAEAVFTKQCKGAHTFTAATPMDVYPFLDSEPPPLNRTLHLISVLDERVDNLEEQISAIREAHPSCLFSFIDPVGIVPAGHRISSYKPDEVPLIDLFRKGNCFWLPATGFLSDNNIAALVKAIAFGLPIVVNAEAIKWFDVADIGWVCTGTHSCKDVFSCIDGHALIDKGRAAKYLARLHLGPDVWLREILGSRQQAMREAMAITPAKGGLVSPYDGRALYLTADEIKAKNILEIGSRYGGSTVYLGAAAKKHRGMLYCIEPIVQDILHENIKRGELGDYITIIQGASPWVDPEKVPIPLDYLFIDGEHFTRWVIADYHYWVPFVRVGGRIAFHDWNSADKEGKMVREAVGLILQTDSGSLKKVDETHSSKWGVVVFEKVREQRLNANLIDLGCLPSRNNLQD
jgi:predicted O-methyltransferase YrrM